MLKIALLVLISFASAQGQQNFTGHKLLGLFASDDDELDLLKELTYNTQLDFWNDPVAVYEKVNLRVPPEVSKNLEDELRSKGIDFYVVTNDLQKWIDEEREENPPDTALAGRQKHFQIDTYHTFDAISAYLDSVGSRYASIASVQSIGTSFEGNPIKAIKIGSIGSNKPAMWIDSGIHAREWVAPATSLYIIEQLVTGYDTDPEIKQLVDTFDWYIVPVANPDGYKYTWSNNRMWRKNRAIVSNPFCRGADPNRNFDSAFGGPGTSADSCSEIFRGSAAFSEAESRAIRDGVLSIGSRLKAFFTLHSYSQLWMTPYGHSRETPPDYEDQLKALQAAATAIQNKHGQWYRHGTIANTIYPAAGSSVDWVYEAANVKYSFAVELRDTGRQGFMLSNTEIIPNAEENWEGIKAVADIVKNEM